MHKPLEEMSLWELDSELLTIDSAIRRIEEADPEDPDLEEIRGYLAERESELEQLFPQKAEGWLRVYLRRKKLFEATDQERKRLAELTKRNHGACDRVKGIIFRTMQRIGIGRWETAAGTLCVYRNGGAESVEKTTDAPVPLQFAAEATIQDPEDFLRRLSNVAMGSDQDRLELAGRPDREQLELMGVSLDPQAFSAAKVRGHVKVTGEVPEGFNIYRGNHLEVK